MEEKEFYRELIKRYKENRATDEELELFFHLLKENKLDAELLKAMTEEGDAELVAGERRGTIITLFSWWRLAAACLIITSLSVAGYLILRHPSTPILAEKSLPIHLSNDVLPGGDRATLTLSDGTTINLDDVGNGNIARQGIVSVIKKDGQLAYTSRGKAAVEEYNSIATPRGGQYQIVLADGTRVWLNAASSLRFPASFSGKERVVEVKGEAYFEVAKMYSSDGKGNRIPFRVCILTASGSGGEIEVLGTHFNVMAYDDELSIQTTLLEGSVKVKKGDGIVVLKPGQQALLKRSEDKLSVLKDVDVDASVAWKNGLFQYDKTNIKTIMRQAARWYDVDVIYEGAISDEYFSGIVPRMKNISELLKLLELTKTVKFTVDGKKIIVRPY